MGNFLHGHRTSGRFKRAGLEWNWRYVILTKLGQHVNE